MSSSGTNSTGIWILDYIFCAEKMMIMHDRCESLKMRRSVRAYVAYVAVKFLNYLDWFLMVVFGIRLQRIDMETFLSSLSPDELQELKDPDILEPVSLHIKALQEDKQLSALCRFTHMKQLRDHLELRIKHKATIIANPSILQTPIRRPLFIIGLPRSGTSLLYNILAQNPCFRAPMMWEMVRPLPPGPVSEWRSHGRYTQTCFEIEFHQFLGDYRFDHIHYMRPDMPEECHFLLERSYYVYHTMLRASTMDHVNDWFFSRDTAFMQKLYAFYKQQLQILGYGHGMDTRHFLRKSHIHLLNLEALLTVFPDACLVFTYRRLQDVIPSFFSMAEFLTGYYGPRNPQLVPRAMKLFSELCNRAAKFFKKLQQDGNGHKNLMFMKYDDLVKDTVGAVKNVYGHFGLEQTKGIEKDVYKYLSNNPQNKHGKHTYTLDEYGITLENVKQNCKPYIEFMSQFTNHIV